MENRVGSKISYIIVGETPAGDKLYFNIENRRARGVKFYYEARKFTSLEQVRKVISQPGFSLFSNLLNPETLRVLKLEDGIMVKKTIKVNIKKARKQTEK